MKLGRASVAGCGMRVAIVAGLVLSWHCFENTPRASAKKPEPSEASDESEPASKGEEPTEFGPVPAGPLKDKRGFVELAIYLREGSTEELLNRARRAARKQMPGLRIVEKVSKDTPLPLLWLSAPDMEEYRPPDEESLSYLGKGLSEAQVRDTANAKVAIILVVAADMKDLDRVHRGLLRLAHRLAVSWNGVVWDEETRELYSPAAWKQQRLGWAEGYPDVSRHVSMHMYRDGPLIRIVTLGMVKFGLPDLVVNQVPREWARAMGSLMNLAGQTLVENPRIAEAGKLPVRIDAIANESVREAQTTDISPNAERKAVLYVEATPPQEGDAANRLFEIMFSGALGETPQVVQARTIDRVYGSTDDLVLEVKHDAEIQAASKRAVAELMKLKPRFEESRSRESLLVKAPFRTTAGGTEWMWVEVTSWKGKLLLGILSNEPLDVPELKEGATVEVEEDTVMDYIHRRADGSETGNETGKLIHKTEEARSR